MKKDKESHEITNKRKAVAGFNFSAGFVDWVLSFKAPMAMNLLWLIPIGV